MLYNNNGMLTFQDYTPRIHYFYTSNGAAQILSHNAINILEFRGISQTMNANDFGTQYKFACVEVYESNIQQLMTRDSRIGVEICP